mmetsp:Transcript_10798/g.23911  ORF Transcript_10798/g.23911 Transcript_10798/m.23911 type:complete len:176 (-) Transcript_10798:506-1033(-)
MESAKHWLTPRGSTTDSTIALAKKLTAERVARQNTFCMKNPIPGKSKISSSSFNRYANSITSVKPDNRGIQDRDSSSNRGTQGRDRRVQVRRRNQPLPTRAAKNANKFIFSNSKSSMDISIVVSSCVESHSLLGASGTEPLSYVDLKGGSGGMTKRKSEKDPPCKIPSKKAHKEV